MRRSVMVRVSPAARERLRRLIEAVPGLRCYSDAIEILSETSVQEFLKLQREIAENER